MTLSRRCLITVACLGLIGCTTGTVMQTARVLPPGERTVTVGAEAFYGSPFTGSRPKPHDWLPALELMMRQSEMSFMDMGFRISPSEVRGDLKLQAFRSNWFDLAVDPSLGILFDPFLDSASASVALIGGVNLIRQPYEVHSLTLFFSAAPTVRWIVADGVGNTGSFGSQSVSAGFLFELEDGNAIVLEGARSWSPFGTPAPYKAYGDAVQVAFGVVWRSKLPDRRARPSLQPAQPVKEPEKHDDGTPTPPQAVP